MGSLRCGQCGKQAPVGDCWIACDACEADSDTELERLRTENARLREALEIYADSPGKYTSPHWARRALATPGTGTEDGNG